MHPGFNSRGSEIQNFVKLIYFSDLNNPRLVGIQEIAASRNRDVLFSFGNLLQLF
jgi:hypothetical protein